MNFPYRAAIKIAGTIGLLCCAACSGDTNAVRDTLVAVGVGANTASSPDFVARSRPTNLDYIPVGTQASSRTRAAKTADELKAAEDEMEALRVQNEALGQEARAAGATSAPEPAEPAPSVKKKPANTRQN